MTPTGTSTIDAAERVRQAAEDEAARRAAGQAEVARLARQQAEAQASREHARDLKSAEIVRLRREAHETHDLANAALQQIDYVQRAARNELQEFAGEHATRRDLAHTRLDDLLADLSEHVAAATKRFAARLCATEAKWPSLTDALTLADQAARLRDVEATAALLHELVDTGEFSELTSSEYEARREQAKRHKAAVDLIAVEVQEHSRELGKALKDLDYPSVSMSESESAGRVTVAAGHILAAKDQVQNELRAMRRVMYPEFLS